MTPEVVGDTENVLAVNKPAGLIVHRDGRTNEPSLAEWVARMYPSLAGLGESWTSPQGEVVPMNGIVHRLDRSTSGVVLIAKTPEAYTHLKEEFHRREVEKIYRAFVYGAVEGEGTLVAEIMRSREIPRRWYARECEASDRRAAITEWRSLGAYVDPVSLESVSYLEVSPKTGRTHQIRVHLSSTGHPLIADHLYARDHEALLGFTRPALHAYSITLELHGRHLTFTAPLPPDFEHAVRIVSAV